MKINSTDFRVPTGKKVNLAKWPTRVKQAYKSKKKYHRLLEDQVEALTSLQRLHYASNGYAVLLILQGMDAAGKDGAIRNVMSGVNPQGCQVFSFKQPSAEELEHAFCGARPADCQSAGGLASSIVRTTRKCSSFASIRNSSAAKGCRRRCSMRKPSSGWPLSNCGQRTVGW